MTNSNDADEWEYEYDEDETEDFYIPIDLSNVPEAQGSVGEAPKAGHPVLIKTRLRAMHANRSQPDNPPESTEAQDQTASMGDIQITGLHTSNPLIMYNGQLLSCHWTSTIGTDMFFVKPSPEGGPKDEPLRSMPSVDLLAMGSAKLIAKAGRLRPRDDVFDSMDDEETMVDQSGVQPANADTNTSQHPADNCETATRELQPAPQSFLAKLNEAKAKRGETSRLIVSQTSNGSRLASSGPSVPSFIPRPRPQSRLDDDIEMSGT